MFENKSKYTIQLQTQAKNTLAYFSQFSEQNNQWQYESKVQNDKRRNLRILDPIKNIKVSRQQKTRSSTANNSQNFYKGRTALIPCKVSLQNQNQNQKGKSRRNLRASCPRNSQYQCIFSKENYKPYKTIRNVCSTSKANDQKQREKEKEEEHGFDFMQYWIRHRFEDGAITTLVEKLRDNKNNTVLRL